MPAGGSGTCHRWLQAGALGCTLTPANTRRWSSVQHLAAAAAHAVARPHRFSSRSHSTELSVCSTTTRSNQLQPPVGIGSDVDVSTSSRLLGARWQGGQRGRRHPPGSMRRRIASCAPKRRGIRCMCLQHAGSHNKLSPCCAPCSPGHAARRTVPGKSRSRGSPQHSRLPPSCPPMHRTPVDD